MTLWNALRSLLSQSATPSRRRSRLDGQGSRSRLPILEPLEGRLCLSTTLETQTLPQLTLDFTTPFQAGGPRTFDLAAGDHTLSALYGGVGLSAST